MSARTAALSFRDVAAALGMSPKTARALERQALATMRRELEAGEAPPLAELTPLERVMLRVVATSYCDRLMRCRPYDAPESEPPRRGW